jgi:hypothetical protein
VLQQSFDHRVRFVDPDRRPDGDHVPAFVQFLWPKLDVANQSVPDPGHERRPLGPHTGHRRQEASLHWLEATEIALGLIQIVCWVQMPQVGNVEQANLAHNEWERWCDRITLVDFLVPGPMCWRVSQRSDRAVLIQGGGGGVYGVRMRVK